MFGHTPFHLKTFLTLSRHTDKKRTSTSRLASEKETEDSDYADSMSEASEGENRVIEESSSTPSSQDRAAAAVVNSGRTIYNSRPSDVERLFAEKESWKDGSQPNYDLMRPELPKPLLDAKVAMAGRHLYVCYQKSSDKFEVRIYTERCRYKFVGGTFYTLTDAVEHRNKALKDVGRDPPKDELSPEESDNFIEQVKEDLGFFNDGMAQFSKKSTRRTNYEKKYAKMLPKYISVKSDRNIFRVVLGINGKRVNVGNYKYLSEAIQGRDEKLEDLGRPIPDSVDENFNLVKYSTPKKTRPKTSQSPHSHKSSDKGKHSSSTVPERRSSRKRVPKRDRVDDDGLDDDNFSEKGPAITPAATSSTVDRSKSHKENPPVWMSTAMNPHLESTVRTSWWSNRKNAVQSNDPTQPGYWINRSDEEAKQFIDKVSSDVEKESKKHPLINHMMQNYPVKSHFV